MKRFVLLLVSSTASAGGFAVTEQTAVSSGTGGAGVARADDPGAAWYDPAALADGGGLRVDVSLIFARPSLEARALDGSWATSNDAAWATPPHVDASYAHGHWAAGLSLGVPFGSGVAWPGDWPGRHEIVRTDIQVFRAAPFFAYRVGALRVSAGMHADAGRLQIARNLDFIDMDGDVRIDMSGHGFGVDAAAYWERPGLSLGLAYRGGTHIDLHGGANFTAPDAFSEKVPDQHAQSALNLPDQLVGGVRAQVARSYAVLGDVEWSRWSSNQQLVVDFEQMQTPDVTQVTAWHDTFAVRAGGEWTHRKLVLRQGAYLEQSPAPADKLAPSSPDSTRLGLSAGASWRFDRRFAVDAFVEAMFLLRRESADAESLQASYGGSATLAGLGLRWTP